MVWASKKEEINFTRRESNRTSVAANPFIRNWTKSTLPSLLRF